MTIVRFALCAIVLLIPTTLMGATLPILSRYAVGESKRTGWTIGRLYGLNSLGAALGALAAAFVLIPAIGLSRTTILAALINFAVGGAALLLARRSHAAALTRKTKSSPSKALEPETAELERWPAAALLLGIGLSGLAGMMYQIGWTRVLSLYFGSSVYVFGLIVSAFISGIALGSIASGPLTRRREPVVSFALLQLGIAIAALILVPILGRLAPLTAEWLTQPGREFGALQGLEFALVFALLLVPTALMGAAFPLAAAAYTRALPKVARSVGNLYGANTLGAIIGVLAAGLLLIPLIGTERTLLVAVAINLTAAGLTLATVRRWPVYRRAVMIAAAAAFGVMVWGLPTWNGLLLTAGPYLYADRYTEVAAQRKIPIAQAMSEGRQLVFFKEGLHAAVSVTKTLEGDLVLGVNGKTDATARADAPTELLVGHLPLLLKPDARDVLLIGLGSGMTLAAVERHPVKSIDVVELEPAIIEASRLFRRFTGSPLDDARAHLTVADGRQYLSNAERPYDVVISEPSNPWVSGMANLFTREFFQSARARLAAKGVMCQWVHAYSMAPEDFRTIVRTFAQVFPHTTLWEADLGNDYLLIGSVAELHPDLDELRASLETKPLRRDMAITNTADVPSLMAKLVLNPEGVREFAGDGPLHTDDNALLEYSAPRGLLRGRSAEMLNQLYAVRAQPWAQLAALGWTSPPQEIANAVETGFAARQEVVAGYVALTESAEADAVVHLDRARSLMPRSYEATYFLARLYYDAGKRAGTAADPNLAQRSYLRGIAVVDGFLGDDAGRLRNHFLLSAVYAQTNIELGGLLLGANQLEAAAGALRRSFAGGIEYPEARTNLGVVFERLAQPDSAEAQYRLALAAYPGHLSARMNLGSLWLRMGRSREAIEQYREALRLQPSNAIAHFNLGAAYFQQRAWREADGEWRRALDIRTDFYEARRALDQVRDSIKVGAR